MNSAYLPNDTLFPLDESLIEAVVEDQSEAALTSLYRRYRHVLRSVIIRVMRDEADADDVLQDVFLQVWNRAESYTPEKGRLLGWLIVVARRRALDRLRQKCAYNRARDRFEFEYRIPVVEQSPNCGVDQQLCEDDLRNLLGNLLQRLPPHQEQVVQMTYFKGMSQRQIAAALELPLGTVKTRIELGMRKLANSLRPLRFKIA
ncbi:sigma-70 family RNA polymerase sigma factor [Phragmitibacter flavus]|uniref:Sigma-70 family RNA polymerase sigma factor n=1 Tax=Phragmitibacter flavus TaxID=2576071 RepID=A0A5R8KIZ5_9BACT|nr:sigma-70 family RNA polymerase sigma factor [Phragmitibacter flavus]TLD72230.1 sigma-70 family RNA polymerase sigma factor [Phragmitibacter flavus]